MLALVLMSQELGTVLCFEAVLMCPLFQASFTHFMALAMTMVVRATAEGPEVLAPFPNILLLHLAEVAAFSSLYGKSCIGSRAKSATAKAVKPLGFLAASGDLQPHLVCSFCLICVESSRDLHLRIAGITLLNHLIEDAGVEAFRSRSSSSILAQWWWKKQAKMF